MSVQVTAAWASGATNKKKVACGRSMRVYWAEETCWKLDKNTSRENRMPTENRAIACSIR